MSKEREVSFPPGVTTYVERFQRFTYADGTIRDAEPVRVLKSANADRLSKAVRGLADSMAAKAGATIVRMERTITVTASEWAPAESDSDPEPQTNLSVPTGFVAAEDIPFGSRVGLRQGCGERVFVETEDEPVLNGGGTVEDLHEGDLLLSYFDRGHRMWKRRSDA